MTNIQQLCDKVQEPLGFKPSYWLLYNLLMGDHSLEKINSIMRLVELADRIDEKFEETLDSSWLEETSRIEVQIRNLVKEKEHPSLQTKEAA